MKTLLIIAISCIALLFTSCEKDEMGIGGTSGGGMDNPHGALNTENIPLNENKVIIGFDIQEEPIDKYTESVGKLQHN